SNTIVVNASGATHLSVSATTPVTAGNTTTVTVTALDAYGNTDTNDNDALTITSSDGQATGLGGHSLASGTVSFAVTLKTAGNQTVSAGDAGHSIAATGSNTIAVNPAGAAQLSVAATTPVTAGNTTTVTVTAKDAFGNTDTNDNGALTVTS